MIIDVEGVPVYFPYDTIYAEQEEYIRTVLRTLTGGGHALIEMPSGTGKTIALLAAAVAYQQRCRAEGRSFRIVYAARTVPEVEKTLNELQGLVAGLPGFVGVGLGQEGTEFQGVGLCARAGLCINEAARSSPGGVDIACRRRVSRLDGLSCDFYEATGTAVLPPGVYTLASLKAHGASTGTCPYYLARRAVSTADCIVYTYSYLLDPAVYSTVSKGLPSDAVIIFDEAHNIDGHCIEVLSISLTRSVLESAFKAIEALSASLDSKGREETADGMPSADSSLRIASKLDCAVDNAIPHFLETGAPEYVPGNLRNTVHLLSVLRRLVAFFKTRLKATHLTSESVKSFAQGLEDLAFVGRRTLSFVSQRLGIAVQRLGCTDASLSALQAVADFSTLLGLHSRGFAVVFEPHDPVTGAFSPVLRLCCLDASIAIAHVFQRFRSVVITSGTLSPMEMYPRILNFVPAVTAEIGATLSRNCIAPLVITKGNDQMLLRADGGGSPEHGTGDGGGAGEVPAGHMPVNSITAPAGDSISTAFAVRNDPSVIRNYGTLLVSLASTVPDNIVVFFPSYSCLEQIVAVWSSTDVISEILRSKLVFVEAQNSSETARALSAHRAACDSGRGGILLAVARGRVSEGVDFEYGYARAVVVLGTPFLHSRAPQLQARLAFLRTEFNIREGEFLSFDAMRHTAQCLGRGLRRKDDYGLMILADARFPALLPRLPRWIRERIERGATGLSIDMAVCIAKAFFREMAQQPDQIAD